MKFVGPDWKSNNEVPIATRSTPGTVIPGNGIQLDELTGVISVNTGVYTITYDLDGGTNSASNPLMYSYNSDTITLEDPTKTGYTFQGWTGSNGDTPQKGIIITPSPESTDLYYTANWTPILYTVTWKQVFKDKNDNVTSQNTYYTQTVDYNNTPTSGYPTTVPAVDMYTSPSNWVYEGTTTQFDPSTPITADTTIVAYYVRQATTYAYVVDENNSTPSTRVSYPSGYDNSSFVTPAKMGSTTFSYGSWNGAFIFDHFKPCALKYDGTVDYYLDPNDYSKKEDGTPSDYNNMNYNGNMMVQVKKMYTKRVYDSANGKRYFYVSDSKVDSDYECDTFKNLDGRTVDYIYLPLFKGSKDSSDRLRSIAGQTLLDSTTTETEVTYASNNGTGWQIWDFSSHELIRDLCTLISKTTDSQTAFGYGYSSASNSTATNSGGLYNKGMFWGGTNKQQVKVFHIEDFWGNRLDRMLGLILYNYNIYTKAYPPYSYTSTSGYTIRGNCGTNTNTGGYYKTVKWTRIGQIPTWTGGSGSSTTYECDYTYFYNGTTIAVFGGFYGDSNFCGSGYVYLGYNADYLFRFIGASPVYK